MVALSWPLYTVSQSVRSPRVPTPPRGWHTVSNTPPVSPRLISSASRQQVRQSLQQVVPTFPDPPLFKVLASSALHVRSDNSDIMDGSDGSNGNDDGSSGRSWLGFSCSATTTATATAAPAERVAAGWLMPRNLFGSLATSAPPSTSESSSVGTTSLATHRRPSPPPRSPSPTTPWAYPRRGRPQPSPPPPPLTMMELQRRMQRQQGWQRQW